MFGSRYDILYLAQVKLIIDNKSARIVRCLSIWIKNNSETIVGSCAQWANWTEVNYPSGWATSILLPSLPTPPRRRCCYCTVTCPQAQHCSRFYIRLMRPWDWWDRAPVQSPNPTTTQQGARRDPRLPWFAPKWHIVVVGVGMGVGKCPFVEVGCAIPYSETLCIIIHSILGGKKRTKRVFNYCHPKINVQGTTKCKILEVSSKAIHNIYASGKYCVTFGHVFPNLVISWRSLKRRTTTHGNLPLKKYNPMSFCL